MLHQIAKTLPGASLARLQSRLVEARAFDWTELAHVHGGYSAPSYREGDGDRALYRGAEFGGRLCFAGEACEDACMTMSAALQSGRRAAREVLSLKSRDYESKMPRSKL
uniref:Amine oxidase domain-containing protein n=1 Tax=Haptolina brevifila TaxID=156173 RepID=A0A7S2CBC1_9EUKA|mmetsp:Transcript_22720/g.45586  ORF Transcript_22720/g.45586 Transcript_22720/m.45586 type:complete len:109 (+) Transcript_22720:573-899(+)